MLVAHSLVQSAVTSLLKLLLTPWKPSLKISFKPIKEMLPFGLRLVGASFVTQLQTNIFSVILGRFYTKTDVGYYSQGSKWASMGHQVFNGMVTSVGQPVLSRASGDKARQKAIFRKLSRFVAFAAFPCMLGLAFIAPEFISLVNAEFMPSVPILRIYCLYFIASLVQTLFNQLAIANGRSGRYLAFTVINAALQIAVALASHRFGLVTMAACVTAANFIAIPIWWLLSRDILGINFGHLVLDMAPYLGIALLAMVPAHFAAAAVGSTILRLLLKIAIVAGLYIAAMLLTDSKTFRDVVTFVKKRELE